MLTADNVAFHWSWEVWKYGDIYEKIKFAVNALLKSMFYI